MPLEAQRHTYLPWRPSYIAFNLLLHQVVLDLGRQPEARFLGRPGGEMLREAPVTVDDLRAAEEAVGAFGKDNRAGEYSKQ